MVHYVICRRNAPTFQCKLYVGWAEGNMLRTFMTLVHWVNREQTLPISQLFVSANTQRFDRAPRWPLSTMDCL